MKHIYRGTIFALVATAIVSSVVCFQLIQAKGEDVKSFKKNDIAIAQTVQIELKKPITLDALFPTGNNSSFDRIILEGEFTFDDESIYDFYVISSKNKKKNIKEDYIRNRKAFLADTKNVTQLSSVNSKNVENILVTKITVMGEKGKINEMKKGLEISKVNVKPTQPPQQIITPQIPEKSIPKEVYLLDDKMIDNKKFSAGAKDTPLYELVPNSGTSYFNPSSYGGRYTTQFMKWDSVNFSEEQTYEHDVFLYNKDEKTYLHGGTTPYPGCWPELTYAATSWPAASRPYVDTRFNMYMVSCDKDELAYTIGAAQASALQANISYYTYIRTEDGNDSSDKFKLQGQIGHRIPNSCYSTWCSFGDGHYNIIPSWSYTVPGIQDWTYITVPAAPSNVFINNPTTASLQVHFTDNATNETSTAIERRISGGSWSLLGHFGALSGTGSYYWTNTGLYSGVTYCYRLKAINAAGSSAYSNEACGTTL